MFVILTTSLRDKQASIVVNRFYMLTFIVAAMTSFGAPKTAFLWLLCTSIRNNTGLRPQLHLKSKHCFDLTSGYSESDSWESLSSVKHSMMPQSLLLLSPEYDGVFVNLLYTYITLNIVRKWITTIVRYLVTGEIVICTSKLVLSQIHGLQYLFNVWETYFLWKQNKY